MCTGVEIAMLASAAVATVGTVAAGQAQASAKKQQQEILNRDAAVEESNAKVRADKIRRMGRMQQGEARADLARSGVAVAEGSPSLIQDYIGQNAETDALSEILTGQRRAASLRAQGSLAGREARNAQTASFIGGASTLLGAASKTGGWKSGLTVTGEGHAQRYDSVEGAYPQE